MRLVLKEQRVLGFKAREASAQLWAGSPARREAGAPNGLETTRGVQLETGRPSGTPGRRRKESPEGICLPQHSGGLRVEGVLVLPSAANWAAEGSTDFRPAGGQKGLELVPQ